MTFRILYSETSRNQIKSLHPELESIIKRNIERLLDDSFLGKALEKDLSGYRSLRTRKFRVLYKADDENRTVLVHYVGLRKDVYELFKEYIRRE